MSRFALCDVCRWPLDECDCAEQRAAVARARANDSQRTGYGRAFGGNEKDERPAIVVRCHRCKQPVELTPFVMDMVRQHVNPMLERRGEKPLADDELTFCRECRELIAAEEELFATREDANRLALWKRARAEGKVSAIDRDWLRRHGWHGDIGDIEELIRRDTKKPARGRRAAQESVD